MSRGLEKMCEEAAHEARLQIALNMLADDLPYEKVAKYTKLPVEEVRALAEKELA